MDLEGMLAEAGGLATRPLLIQLLGRRGLAEALAAGQVVRVGQGRYALPAVADGVRAAHALRGVLSHTSAALHHGWEVLHTPDRPHVLVPVQRKISADRRRDVVLHRADLARGETSGPATTQEVTLRHCLQTLPLPEALAVADSALRHGVSPATLRRAAMTTGPGARQARRVAREARAEADNPFESGLRALSLDVPGVRLTPQVWVKTRTGRVRPDLVDEQRRLVVEADSFEWHGRRAALKNDARRYNELVIAGWMVLRFAWEDVMFEPERVQAVLAGAASRLAGCACGRPA